MTNPTSTYVKAVEDGRYEYGTVQYGKRRTQDRLLLLGIVSSYVEAEKAAKEAA